MNFEHGFTKIPSSRVMSWTCKYKVSILPLIEEVHTIIKLDELMDGTILDIG
jgi:hypothetical protein